MLPLVLKEVEHPSLMEIIDELFDNATSFMTENSVIYGGALNSLISGLAAEKGDLDIAVSRHEFDELAENFASSTKWLQVEGDTIAERDGGRPSFRLRSQPKLRLSRYEEEEVDLPLDQVVAFQTINGKEVQVIQSSANKKTALEDAIEVVNKVDFRNCGLAMNRYGKLFEIVPGAYSDCLSRVIRIANYRPGEPQDRLRARLEKYLNRGWSLGIAYDRIFENFRLAAANAKPKRKKTKNVASYFRIGTSNGKRTLVIDPFILNRIGISTVRKMIERAANHMNIGLSLHNDPVKGLIIVVLTGGSPLTLRDLRSNLIKETTPFISPAKAMRIKSK